MGLRSSCPSRNSCNPARPIIKKHHVEQNPTVVLQSNRDRIPRETTESAKGLLSPRQGQPVVIVLLSLGTIDYHDQDFVGSLHHALYRIYGQATNMMVIWYLKVGIIVGRESVLQNKRRSIAWTWLSHDLEQKEVCSAFCEHKLPA